MNRQHTQHMIIYKTETKLKQRPATRGMKQVKYRFPIKMEFCIHRSSVVDELAVVPFWHLERALLTVVVVKRLESLRKPRRNGNGNVAKQKV